MTVQINELSASEVSRQWIEIQAVYEAMYALPPGSATGFGPVLMEQTGWEGFRLCAAVNQETGQMIGVGYGFTGQPGQPWRDELTDAIGAEAAAEWLMGHFEFAEFGVIPSMWRRGTGTQLYKTLFHGLPHERAVLTVREQNKPARRFYYRRKWGILYQGFFARAGHGPYLIMGKLLTARS